MCIFLDCRANRMVAITVDRKNFFDDAKFRIFYKRLRRNKFQELAAGGFDLPASGLWAQHASTAPSCADAAFIE